jgi:hypothetical protein
MVIDDAICQYRRIKHICWEGIMPARKKMASLAIALPLLALAGVAYAQQPAGGTDAEYTARVMTAAPPQIVQDATIVRMVNGALQTLKKGTSEFTCMENNGTPMCMDSNAMEWAHAWQTHAPAPDKVGFIYMLNGDTGASNTDPWAAKSEPGNHWVKTGAHVMIVGPAAKTMAGYPRTPDPDPTKPYVMWPGSPYEHLMLPVK